jgi:hypothetical protein
MIETLAEARDSRMTLTARCAWGRREGMNGEKFPISMLGSRLKCPRRGSRRVVLMFGLPGQPVAKRA